MSLSAFAKSHEHDWLQANIRFHERCPGRWPRRGPSSSVYSIFCFWYDARNQSNNQTRLELKGRSLRLLCILHRLMAYVLAHDA